MNLNGLHNNHVWYKGYLIPENQKIILEKMAKEKTLEKVSFGELNAGDRFYHNTFEFVKGGSRAGEEVTKFIPHDKQKIYINATCLTDRSFSAHFADNVKVIPLDNE